MVREVPPDAGHPDSGPARYPLRATVMALLRGVENEIKGSTPDYSEREVRALDRIRHGLGQAGEELYAHQRLGSLVVEDGP